EIQRGELWIAAVRKLLDPLIRRQICRGGRTQIDAHPSKVAAVISDMRIAQRGVRLACRGGHLRRADRRGVAAHILEAAVTRSGSEQDRDAVRPLRSEEHTSELQSQSNLVCRLLLEKNNDHESSQ